MLLCIDLGNTNTTFAIFAGKELLGDWRIRTDHQKMPDEYGVLMASLLERAGHPPYGVDGICLCSVVPPLTDIFVRACESFFNVSPLVIRAMVGVNIGVKIGYDDPREVGADRLADAAAVFRLYGGPACVVDFGTATTFNAISASGDYVGGAICPGIGISADALFSRTSKLPRVELIAPPKVIGTNSINSIQSGLLFGYASLVEGMVARFRAELGPDTKVIATGGWAELMSHETRCIDVIDPLLTLKGLQIIWELNS